VCKSRAANGPVAFSNSPYPMLAKDFGEGNVFNVNVQVVNLEAETVVQ